MIVFRQWTVEHRTPSYFFETDRQDMYAKIGWPTIGVLLSLAFSASSTTLFAEEGKDSEQSLCCCLRPPCVIVDSSEEARSETNNEVNSSLEKDPPCGAPGS